MHEVWTQPARGRGSDALTLTRMTYPHRPTAQSARLLVAALALCTSAVPAAEIAALSKAEADSPLLLGYHGEARALEGGELLYTEEHLLRGGLDAPSQRLVVYRCADGTAFARKLVDYAPAALAPSFELRDARIGYREGLRREGERLLTFAGDVDELLERPIEDVTELVADSGFDRLVRQRWDALQAGRELEIGFLVPSRGKALDFRVRKTAALSVDGAPASQFELSLGGLLGLFAPSIKVVYRDADRWLLSFSGLTNIRAGLDENLEARIEFPQVPSAQSEQLWQDYAALSLSSCALGDESTRLARRGAEQAQSRGSP
jgi:hypothetical protein